MEKVVAVNYNGTYYYYLRNAQGDIVKLIDKTGTAVVEYTYDSWGKLLRTTGSLSATFGKEQPFRYRGYVYDEETSWYYLQSRYYNPEIGKFISADVYLSTGRGVLGHNAYAYCRNNPIVRLDPSGMADEDETDIYNLIKDNTEKASRLKRSLFINYCIGGMVNARGIRGILYLTACTLGEKYGMFYLNVKTNGPMDYKNKDRWRSSLPRLAYPDNNGEEYTYMFHGEKRSASDIGNINYGAVGAALGIPLEILLWQAGATQLRDHGKLRFFRSQFDSIPKAYYEDERDDYINIKLGYDLYLNGYFGG